MWNKVWQERLRFHGGPWCYISITSKVMRLAMQTSCIIVMKKVWPIVKQPNVYLGGAHDFRNRRSHRSIFMCPTSCLARVMNFCVCSVSEFPNQDTARSGPTATLTQITSIAFIITSWWPILRRPSIPNTTCAQNSAIRTGKPRANSNTLRCNSWIWRQLVYDCRRWDIPVVPPSSL